MSAKIEPQFRQYILDDFQIEAIQHLLNGDSVLVSAPTGVGKTLIADYLIEDAIKGGRRVVYTAPIKALSNQKYKEFKRLYGERRVGIITGDVVINAEAEVAIMTTEIFRNILQQDRERLEDISHVIFDEIHYLSDEDRGTVWEESIIFMPESLRLLGLSATIPNARELADWIEEIKGHQVKVVNKKDRAVPLEHFVYHPFTAATTLNHLEKEFKKRLERSNGEIEVKRSFDYQKTRVRAAREVSHKALINYIRKKNGLPCLYFVFSRM